MKKGKYENLREQYPEMISLDQLYRICRISKRSAVYLVANGIIPFTDTGKKTWRYRIAIDDVIIYLRQREQKGSMIPVGAVTSRTSKKNFIRKPYSEYLKNNDNTQLKKYFAFVYSDYPETLSVLETAEMTGLSRDTILDHIRAGSLQKISTPGRFVIPKHYVIEFASSRSFIECRGNSETFRKLIRGFEVWEQYQDGGSKNAPM